MRLLPYFGSCYIIIYRILLDQLVQLQDFVALLDHKMDAACANILELRFGFVSDALQETLKQHEVAERVHQIGSECKQTTAEIEDNLEKTFEGLVLQEGLDKRKEKAAQAKNAMNILTTTAAMLIKSTAEMDPLDANVLALRDMLLKPPSILSESKDFGRYQTIVDPRLHAAVERKLLALVSPLLQQTAFKGMLQYLTGQGSMEKACSWTLEAASKASEDVSMAELEEAKATGHTLLASWLPWASRTFQITDCQEVMPETEGEDAAEGGVAPDVLQLELWLLCMHPACCELVGRSLLFSRQSEKVKKDDPASYAQVAQTALQLESASKDFRAALQDLPLDEACDGQRLQLCNKACRTAESSLLSCSAAMVSEVASTIRACHESIAELLQSENLSDVMGQIEGGCDASLMGKLLGKAQSKQSKELHSCVKKIDALHEVCKALQPLQSLSTKVDGLEDLSINQQQATDARNLNVTLACVQALARPLKEGEARGALARRARVMVISKKDLGVTVPASLDLLLTQVGAAAP